ncbi:MAG: HEAT repeat domain-containing protein, partial [Candidatus Latescibacteria bacterium]|nr:HEAT repeat domain-containing protein [Candidatus Latescibacterota bacterium]
SAAEWDWYAGDIVYYPAQNTSTVVPEWVQEAIDADLDWLVLAGFAWEGAFTGVRDIAQEHDLNAPRITPIAGTGWDLPGGPRHALAVFGVDPRAPIPQDSLQQVVGWVEAHEGVSIQVAYRLTDDVAPSNWRTATAFQGVQSGVWASECEPGAAWDHLLTSGHRILLIGGSDPHAVGGPGGSQKTYVWAEDNGAESIIDGIRRGASYVAQSDGIRMDLQVNGRPMGALVPVGREAYVRIRASARHAISRVSLVADGDIVWSAEPDTTVWEARFFLPLTGKTYVRPVLESEEGSCKSLGNPVFLVPEALGSSGEMPLEDADRAHPEPVYLEPAGFALEVSAGLTAEAQHRFLGELLRDPGMRHSAVRVLEVREDLIPDRILQGLSRHPDPEVRLGAAYALVVRSPPEIGGFLVELLNDEDGEVRTYAARMLCQFTEGVVDATLPALRHDQVPSVRMHLIRAVDPAQFEPELTGYLISNTRSSHRGVATAAVDKLLAMGTRNFQVLKSLLDSARAGNPSAVGPIALIGDRRSIEGLEEIYAREDHGPLKRASFLALEEMGSPYMDRKRAVCTWITQPPQIDGRLDPDEWRAATPVSGFAGDFQGTPWVHHVVDAWVGNDSTRLFLSVVCADSLSPSSLQVRRRDEPGLLDDVRLECVLSSARHPDVTSVLAVTPLGAVHDSRGGETGWDPDWEVAGYLGRDRWSIEAAIPLDAIGVDSGSPLPSFRFNMSLVAGPAPADRLTWSITYGSPGNPQRFGDLHFATAPLDEGPENE